MQGQECHAGLESIYVTWPKDCARSALNMIEINRCPISTAVTRTYCGNCMVDKTQHAHYLWQGGNPSIGELEQQ
jgi:hypothetical protein